MYALPTFSKNVTRGKVFSGGRIGSSLCGYDMFLGEHVLYGNERLGTSTYDNYKVGYSGNALAYPKVAGTYLCYLDPDEAGQAAGHQTITGTVGITGGNLGDIRAYGPGRVPELTRQITGTNLPWVNASVKPTKEPSVFAPGHKRYEFGNHLGNVLVTVSDMPIGHDNGSGVVDYYIPNVLSTSDYGAFGEKLTDRTEVQSGTKPYIAGFNGQMKDDEMYGEGDSYDFESRMYNPRLGRFMSEDPTSHVYTFLSPYAFAANSPIMFVDEDGMFPAFPSPPRGRLRKTRTHFGQRTITKSFYIRGSRQDNSASLGAPPSVSTTVGSITAGGITIGGFLTRIAMNPNLAITDVSMKLAVIGTPGENHGNKPSFTSGAGFATGPAPENIYTYIVGSATYMQNTVTAPRALYPGQDVNLMDPVAINFMFGAAANGNIDGCYRYSLRFDIVVEVERQLYAHPYTPRVGNADGGVVFTPRINPPTRFTLRMLRWNSSWRGNVKFFNEYYRVTPVNGTPTK